MKVGNSNGGQNASQETGTQKLTFRKLKRRVMNSTRFQEHSMHACILNAHESTRQRLDSHLLKIMKITLQVKDTLILTHEVNRSVPDESNSS